jgi:hypothetical protein
LKECPPQEQDGAPRGPAWRSISEKNCGGCGNEGGGGRVLYSD